MTSSRLVSQWFGKYKENLLVNRLFAVLSIDILVKLSGVLLLPIYLRLMTQQEFGLYNYLLSIISTFAVVLNFGLFVPLTKFYHDYKDRKFRARLVFTIVSLLLSFLLIFICIAYFFGLDFKIIDIVFKNQIDYSQYRDSVILAISVSVLNLMLTSFFFTSERISQVNKYNILRIILINIATIALLYFFNSWNSVALRLKSTYVIELILLILFLSFYFSRIKIDFDRRLAVSSLKMAFPVMISAIFGIIINFGDKFFLEKYGNFTDLSIYYLAISFAALLPMIFASLQNAWLPIFLKEKDLTKNLSKTKKLMGQLSLGFLVLSFFIWIGFKLLLILEVIPGKYNEVIYILPILLLSQIISALVPLYTNYLIYFEKTYIAPITGLFVCLIVFALSIWLIPKFGIYGAALVALAANAVYFLIYFFIINYLIRKHLQEG